MTQRVPIPGPLSLGDLLDRTFRLYRAHFRVFVLTSAILMLPATILTGLLSGVYSQVLLSVTGFDGRVLAYFGVLLLLTLVGLALQGLASLALTRQGLAGLAGEPVSIGDGLRVAWRRFPSWLGMSMLEGLAFGGVLLVALIPLLIIVGVAATLGQDASGLAVIGLLCGYGLFLIIFLAPFLYLEARWIAALPALLGEKLGATNALGRSWRLTKGRVWRSIGYFVLLGVLSLVLVSLPLIALQQVLALVLPLGLIPQSLISSLLGGTVSAFWTPLALIAYLLYYYDLRVRAEGYDLEQRVAALEAEIQPEEPGTASESGSSQPG